MVRKGLIFDPASGDAYDLSRTKIELFTKCPRCFYLRCRLGVKEVDGFPFSLNNAVDDLLKKEFDSYRETQTSHPLMVEHGIDAVPFQHEQIEQWRQNFVGIRFHHPATNFLVFGALDDVWVNPDGALMVVDYKATSTSKEITLDDDWKQQYKRQLEVYQWLLRRNGFDVLDTGYFVYVNGSKDRPAFDARLDFDMHLLAYTGSDSWVEETLGQAHDCLASESRPSAGEDCKWCSYRDRASAVEA